MERLTPAERVVLTFLLAAVAILAGWRYWALHRITHTPVPLPETVWAGSAGPERPVEG